MNLVDEILSGSRRDLQLLAAAGMVPLPPTELLPLQVQLAESDDIEIADRAATGIALTDATVIQEVVSTTAAPAVLDYFARNSRDSRVVEAILKRRDVGVEIVRGLAPRLGPDLQELLLLRQDLIVESPDLLDALEGNTQLSPSSRRRILEYREHLLMGLRKASLQAEADLPGYQDPEVLIEIDRVRPLPAEGEHDEVTGLSEGQIRLLPIPARLKLARGAPRTLRNLLVRDTNTMVALEVVRANNLNDSEVEQLAKSRVVCEEILEEIARRREWIRKYAVIYGLATNPKCPVAISVRLVTQLSVKDLRNLARDRNVPDAVRQTAARIYRVKSA